MPINESGIYQFNNSYLLSSDYFKTYQVSAILSSNKPNNASAQAYKSIIVKPRSG